MIDEAGRSGEPVAGSSASGLGASPVPPVIPVPRSGGGGGGVPPDTRQRVGGGRKPGGGSGRAWALVGLIVALFLAYKLVSGIGTVVQWAHFGGHGSGHGGRKQAHWLEEVVTEDNGAKDKIAVIEVAGVIASEALDHSGHDSVDLIKEQLGRAEDDEQVKAVLLKVDSPGGEVLASDEIYRALAAFQKDSGKPVVVSMGGMAASGGYYVSAPCRWIVANELTITGSIGVIMHGYNYRGLMDKVGIRPEVFKSGPLKDMLSGDKLEVSPTERALVQGMIDETFRRFKEVVREGRGWAASQNEGEGKSLARNWEEFADGRILTGRQALQLGLVDELGNLDTALDRILELTGLENYNLVRYEPPFELSGLLRLLGKTESRASLVKIDLGMDFPRLQAGRMYFLASHLFQ